MKGRQYPPWLLDVREGRRTLRRGRDRRLAWLRRWSTYVLTVALSREDVRAKRLAYLRKRASYGEPVGHCWACSHRRPLIRHHIVQLQHGGNSHFWNMVDICEDCHAEIHPWLPRPNYEPAVEDWRWLPTSLSHER